MPPVRRKSQPETPNEPVQTYGCKFTGKNQLFYDRWAFAFRVGLDAGAPRRKDLFRRITDKLVPGWFEWHEWTERAVEGMCENKWLAFSGCSSSCKTRNITGFACAWWMCAPGISNVILCSTTAKSLRKRAWAEVQSFHTTIPGPRVGNFVDSRIMWQANKGDDRHAIVGIAVEEGEMNKVADNIKGVHTQRQMVVIDEATAVPPAIFEACTNLYSYPKEFVLVMLGNPRSRMDEFGKFMEPYKGWNSVSVDTEEWETKPQMDGVRGIVIRFDVEKTPNLNYPEDRPISRHLPSIARVRAAKSNPAYQDSPSYWSNERGFPPPDGMNKTVFTEVAIEERHGKALHTFTGKDFTMIGAFDHARTGDRPTLRLAAMGEIAPNTLGVEVMKPIEIPVRASSKQMIDYQLLDQVRRHCETAQYRGQRMPCPPANLGIDAGGGGADLCDIFQQGWSPAIHRIQFGGAASTIPCSNEDVRPANEVYRNKRAEMYFRSKAALLAGQLRGLDDATCKELCSIEYDDTSRLIVMMSKEDYRLKYKNSPDFADTLVMVMEMAVRKGFKLAVIGFTADKHKDDEKDVSISQSVYHDIDYGRETEDDLMAMSSD